MPGRNPDDLFPGDAGTAARDATLPPTVAADASQSPVAPADDASVEQTPSGPDATVASDASTPDAGPSKDATTTWPNPDRPTSCADPIDALAGSPIDASGDAEIYALDADTLRGLRQQMTSRSPASMAAATEWYVSWSYGGECDASALTVTLEAYYSMPRWNRPAGVDEEVIDGWSSYIDALWCHEYGHTDFGVAVAKETYEALSELPSTTSSCNQLYSEADQVFNEILNQQLAAEDAYDVTTNHGASMGARLPTDPDYQAN